MGNEMKTLRIKMTGIKARDVPAPATASAQRRKVDWQWPSWSPRRTLSIRELSELLSPIWALLSSDCCTEKCKLIMERMSSSSSSNDNLEISTHHNMRLNKIEWENTVSDLLFTISTKFRYILSSTVSKILSSHNHARIPISTQCWNLCH